MKIETISTEMVGDHLSQCDGFLCACGYERRSRSILQIIGTAPGRKLCLGFEEHPEAFSRKDNDRAFAEAAIPVKLVSGSSPTAVRSAVSEILQSVPDGGSALIDITSMTRVWHAAIISELLSTSGRKRLRTVFVYVPAVFTAPPADFPRTKHVAPLEGFTGFGLPNLPTALVVGLGYEPERALGLQALLDPSVTAVFVAQNLFDSSYYRTVLEKNRDLIQLLRDEWVFEYPLADAAATFHILESLCAGLAADFRVVLASLGPKIFGLQCLLLAAMNPALSVWRVSSGSSEPREAEGHIENASACSVTWIDETGRV